MNKPDGVINSYLSNMIISCGRMMSANNLRAWCELKQQVKAVECLAERLRARAEWLEKQEKKKQEGNK